MDLKKLMYGTLLILFFLTAGFLFINKLSVKSDNPIPQQYNNIVVNNNYNETLQTTTEDAENFLNQSFVLQILTAGQTSFGFIKNSLDLMNNVKKLIIEISNLFGINPIFIGIIFILITIGIVFYIIKIIASFFTGGGS